MAPQPKRADRALIGLMIGVMAVAAIAAVALWYVAKSDQSQSAAARPDIGGPFTLTDQTGKTVTDKTYDGYYRLIYFGYTFCPDACPTALQMMAVALDEMGPMAEKVQPIFITIDPARDTAQQMAGYVPNFYKRLVGLTGTPEQIAAVAKEYKVYYAKAEDSNPENYLMNHSSFIYLMDRKGGFITVFPSDTGPDTMAQQIKGFMAER